MVLTIFKFSQLALALLALPLSLAAPTIVARDELGMTSFNDPEYLAEKVTIDDGLTIYTRFLTDEAKEAVALAAKVGFAESLRLRGNELPATEPAAVEVREVESSNLDGRDIVTGRGTGLFKRGSYCGLSSFDNQSSGGSPTVGDCNALKDKAYAMNVYWGLNTACGGTIWNNNSFTCYYTLLTQGTCLFGGTQAQTNNIPYALGSADMGDLTRDSIAKFSWNGLVGAKGAMYCDSPADSRFQANIQWAIYHV